MAKENKKQAVPSTKDFVEIAQIKDTVLVLKNGSLRSVVEVNAINFELKSQDEQTAIIQAFQNFLNAIDFPLQIAVSSRKLDAGKYLKLLDELLEIQQNELLKIQISEYRRFISGLTELADIMTKKFYLVVPFHAVETPVTKTGMINVFKGLFTPAKLVRSLNEEELAIYKTQLNQRIDLIRGEISGMGLESKILDEEELVNLFYSYYNPGHHL